MFGSGRRGWRRGEWMSGLGMALPILWEQGEWSVGRVSVFGLRWCGWCRWGVGLLQGLTGWGGVMSV